jgi:hypothetical protein
MSGHGSANTALHGFKMTGRRAFAVGLKPADCPLKPGSPARNAWMAGYHEARKEAEDENAS